jgi:ABC-type nitrate/sulfonate/bicarbonate transport system substrate-binding protein
VTRRIHWHHTGVRFSAILTLAVLVAGCGGSGSTGSFGDVTVALGAKPDANDIGVYFAQARGYDEAEGLNFKLAPAGATAELTFVTGEELARRRDLVGVMAIVQPSKLVVAVPRDSLDEDKDEIEAAIRALQRGYLQAQIEPDEAVQAMLAAVPDLDTSAISAQLDQVSPTWSNLAYLGLLPAGKDFDRSLARPQAANQ